MKEENVKSKKSSAVYRSFVEKFNSVVSNVDLSYIFYWSLELQEVKSISKNQSWYENRFDLNFILIIK